MENVTLSVAMFRDAQPDSFPTLKYQHTITIIIPRFIFYLAETIPLLL